MVGLVCTALCLDNRDMQPQPLAYLDGGFLDSDEGRPLRILAEYLEPLRRFKAQNIQDTVVFFGSARIHRPEHAEPTPARPPPPGTEGGGGVGVWGGRARARAPADRMVAPARLAAPSVRGHLRRRP